VLLDFGAPGKVRLPVGQEHDRTIPLADVRARAADLGGFSLEVIQGRSPVPAAFLESRVKVYQSCSSGQDDLTT
jgi:hypothetical protein